MNIGGYEFLEGLYYDKDHGWTKDEGDYVTLGVTDFFQKLAGEIVFIELPAVGRKIEFGKPFSSIESGKWVGRLKAPLNGEILEVNDELVDFPYVINESYYDEGWIAKVKPVDKPTQLAELMQLGEDFEAFIQQEDEKYKE